MAGTLVGPLTWDLEADKDSYRDYTVKWLIRTDSKDDGPLIVALTPGLPAIGSYWNIGNDVDTFALCWPNWRIQPHAQEEGEPHFWWSLTQRFSTRPISRCQDVRVENPLNEPPKINGGFHKYTKKFNYDKDNKPFYNTAWQRLTGPETEFDENRPTTKIGVNVLLWPGTTYTPMVDTVNDQPLWGFQARCIKLSNVSYTRLVYGVCGYYFFTEYEFDQNSNTFDRTVDSYGTKCLIGTSPGSDRKANPLLPTNIDPTTGDANYLNPLNYEDYLDTHGNIQRVPLDQYGVPVTVGNSPYQITLKFYKESNFLSLPGLPISW